MNALITEYTKVLNGLAPSADLFNGDPATDIVNMAGYNRCSWFLFCVATTGTAVVTVEAVDNVAGSNATALAFTYRKKATLASETWGDITAATTSGFTTTVSDTGIYEITVTDAALPASQQYVRAVFTEGVDAAVIGSVTIMLSGGRYKDPNMPSAIV